MFPEIVRAIAPVDGITIAAAIDGGSVGDSQLTALVSESDRAAANQMAETSERRHYLFRRAFQRVFVHQALNWAGPIHEISIVHQRDQRPLCVNSPHLNLSFSSSGAVVLACASGEHSVGIDIEKIRVIENVVSLAQRFFKVHESEFIRNLPASRQSHVFLEFWTAKEAGLKALAKGIDSGLNSFELTPQPFGYDIKIQQEFGVSNDWQLRHLAFLQDHIVAVVHRPVNNRSSS